jgi:hypothetical protein
VSLPPGSTNRRRYTRTRATSLSFSWRGRLLWSAPPLAFLLWLASGPLGEFNPLAWLMGLPMLYLTIRWLRHVWTRIPLPPILPEVAVAANDHDVLVGSDRVGAACHDGSVMIIARGDTAPGVRTPAVGDVPGRTGT